MAEFLRSTQSGSGGRRLSRGSSTAGSPSRPCRPPGSRLPIRKNKRPLWTIPGALSCGFIFEGPWLFTSVVFFYIFPWFFFVYFFSYFLISIFEGPRFFSSVFLFHFLQIFLYFFLYFFVFGCVWMHVHWKVIGPQNINVQHAPISQSFWNFFMGGCLIVTRRPQYFVKLLMSITYIGRNA